MYLDIYNEKIKPLVTEIENICKENKIPMFFALCSDIDKEHNGNYITHVVSPTFLDINIKNDNIADCFKVFNGYTPVYNESKGMSFGDSLYLDIDDEMMTEEVVLDANSGKEIKAD